MKIPFAIVDAFCIPGEPFTGNQAAVCILPSDDIISDEIKQKIAAEINLSETSFVSNSWTGDDPGAKESNRNLTIRWFTPSVEVPLCGHATLASAKIIFDSMEQEVKDEKATTISLETKFKGTLGARMIWETGRISLNFPLSPTKQFTTHDIEFLPKIIEAVMQPLGADQVHSCHFAESTNYLLIRLHDHHDEKSLRSLEPDFSALLEVKENKIVMGLIVTVKGDDDVHFYSRFFAPLMGINEDPVTGSAHCVLAHYWSEESNGMTELKGKQCSKRGGIIHCKLGSKEEGRVTLEGSSQIVVRGELIV